MKSDQLMFLRDLNYKLIKPISSIYQREKSHFIIPIWKIDRLSLIRCIVFLEKFFPILSTKKQTILLKYSRIIKKKKTKIRLVITVSIPDIKVLILFLKHMSIPRVLSSLNGYLLIFSFYHFKLTIPVTIKNPAFTYKLMQRVKLK